MARLVVHSSQVAGVIAAALSDGDHVVDLISAGLPAEVAAAPVALEDELSCALIEPSPGAVAPHELPLATIADGEESATSAQRWLVTA